MIFSVQEDKQAADRYGINLC